MNIVFKRHLMSCLASKFAMEARGVFDATADVLGNRILRAVVEERQMANCEATGSEKTEFYIVIRSEDHWSYLIY
jgi:hypothetical protein